MKDITQGIDGVIAHRIGQGHRDGFFIGQHRHHSVLSGDVGGKIFDDVLIYRIGVDMAVFQTELIGHGTEDLVFAYHSAGNENVKRGLVFSPHGLGGGFNLVGGQEPVLDQHLHHILIVTCHLVFKYILFR